MNEPKTEQQLDDEARAALETLETWPEATPAQLDFLRRLSELLAHQRTKISELGDLLPPPDARIDRRIVARKERQDLDEQVRIMEEKGWKVLEDAEVNPHRPNPSEPPWPTVLMTRPVLHPEHFRELLEELNRVRQENGRITIEISSLKRLLAKISGAKRAADKAEQALAEYMAPDLVETEVAG